MITDIEQQLAKLYEGEYVPPKGFHIFHRLLQSIDSQIDREQRMKLIWVFTMTEKALRESRRGNSNFSSFYFNELEKYSEKENALMVHVQNFVIRPAKAFLEYNNFKNHQEAIDLLLEAIESILWLCEEEYVYMIVGATEQYMNICRDLLKMDEKMFAFTELGNLIYYLLSGRCHTTLTDLSKGSEFQVSLESDLQVILEFVTNVSVDKLLREQGDQLPLYFGKLFNWQAQCNLKSDPRIQNYRRCFSMIQKLLCGQTCKITDEIIQFISDIRILPRQLQYFFLIELQRNVLLHTPDNKSVYEALKQYCVDKLDLSGLFESENINAGEQYSPLRKVEAIEQEILT